MIWFYTFFNFLYFYFVIKKYKKFLNPLSLYSIIWQIALTVHECGLIQFYDINPFTWFIIIVIQVLLYIGFNVGNNIKMSNQINESEYDELVFRNELKKWLIITMIIAGIAIVYNFWSVIKIYGSNLLNNLNLIYFERVNDIVSIESIPYLGSFIFITLILCGIYIKKYGFTILLFPALILTFMNSLTSGGRTAIVFNFLLLISAYYFTDTNRKKQKRNFKNKFYIIVGIITFFVMFTTISNQRATDKSLIYATDNYEKVFNNNPTIYKTLIYIGAPIGTLNEYLKNCDFNFGHNTFLPIYNILAKLHLIDKINQYQDFYNVPMDCNTGTWIRELTEDFTIGGVFIVIIVFGIISGYVYKAISSTNKIQYIVAMSNIFLIIGMSFFDWRLRTFNVWISIIFGFLVAKHIWKKSIIKIGKS